MRRFACAALLVLVSLAVASRAAYAIPMLRLTDPAGPTVVLVADQQIVAPIDSNGIVGAITYIGAVGANWVLNVTTGISKPFQGTPALPHLDLNSVNATSAGAGTLIIEFTDDFFGPLPAGWNFRADVGGTTPGTVSYSAFSDAANVLFATTTLLTSQGPFGPGAFSGTAFSGPIAGAFPYSITQKVVITHAGTGTSSLDAELTAVPEPSAILLLGSGLAGFGYLWRRRRAKASPVE